MILKFFKFWRFLFVLFIFFLNCNIPIHEADFFLIWGSDMDIIFISSSTAKKYEHLNFFPSVSWFAPAQSRLLDWQFNSIRDVPIISMSGSLSIVQDFS